MTKRIKLGDHAVLEANTKKRASYRAVITDSLAAEKICLSDNDLIELSEMAFQCECGTPYNMLEHHKKTYQLMFDQVASDSEKLNFALTKLVSVIEGISVPTALELIEKLEKKGISTDTVNVVLTCLKDTAEEMAGYTRPLEKKGNKQGNQAGWLLKAWELLKSGGIGMRPASRILSKVFHVDENKSDSIYQAIRNHETR